MELFLNAGLGAGILMFFVLFFKIGKKNEDYFFLSWIAVVLLQITFYDITIYHFDLKGIWAVLGFGLPLLGGPLLFLYIAMLVNHKVTYKKIFLHLSIYTLYVLILIIFQYSQNFTFIVSKGFFYLPRNAPFWVQFYAIPMAISGLVYCILGLILLKKHQKRIVNFFSFDEKINLKWVQYIVYSFFILFFVSSFLIFGATRFNLFPMENVFAFVGIALSMMLVAFGFYGFRQTSVFSNINSIKKEKEPGLNKSIELSSSYSKSGLTEEKIKYHAQRLTEHMVLEKPFLQEDLTLPVLADECKLSNTHLSQIINQHFQVNFYDFVNQYRIEESKKMLVSSDYDHLSLLGIAFDCGFKSKSSFNRYFKKYCRITPSEFKKNN
jgi:AraC-like DNA-binding protein